MKKLIACLAMAGLLGPAVVPAIGQEVVEEIVAVVNDDIITLTEYRNQFEMAAAQLRAQQMPPEEYAKQYDCLKKQFLDLMITELLLLQKAKELGLNVQEQLKGMLEKIKQENNFASDQDLRRAIQSQGMSYEAWLREYEEGMMRQGVLYTEVERSIVLEDSEVVQYYKKNPAEFTVPTEYRLNAVYLATTNRTAEECETLKAAIDAKLKGGTPFGDVAAELSDPPMKDARGDLGTFKEGELEKDLEAPVERIKAGETAPWINTKNGWYLLQLVEKKDSHLKPFDEARGQVEEKIYAQKRAVKGEEYMKTLRERSYVKILKADPLGLDK